MSELTADIIALVIFVGLVAAAIVSTCMQLRAYHARHVEQKQALAETLAYEREVDPRYQAKLEAERHYELRLRELRLKEFQAFTQVQVPQYGLLIREELGATWAHIAPIHKPLAIKGAEDQGMADIPGVCTFSQVLASFRPSSEQILLGYLPGETPALATAEGLCHVALAGATGNGKSVLVRLLIAQLCFVGASVLLLNPHYTRYDLRSNEDWTPFEPYLYDDPMKCKRYDVIGEYLRMAAQEMLPTRLERYSQSLPIGKPFYIILDELPAIVKHVPEAPGYMADLLREGRKVGLFLVTAAQDFLVKTIMGNEGGAVRDCFRTSIYVGGDAQTARVLLDVKGTVDDGGLGQGVVMLRAASVKQAQLARVPYVDNEALYQLLGPSTYIPAQEPIPSRFRPGMPDTEWAQRDDDERNVIDADPVFEEQPTNIFTFPQSEVRSPVGSTQRDSAERNKYQLSNEEIDQFKVAYRACGNIDKALAAIGKGTHYRESARRVIKVYGLREEA